MRKKILIYDTTLRDGAQAEFVSFGMAEKLKILQLLDDLGIHYVEGGWPGSNPKDMAFFQAAKKIKLKNTKLAAFGSTAHPKNKNVRDDKNLQELVNSEAPVITIFGKTWDLHVKEALKTSLKRNLELIEESVRFLKDKNRTVLYDAEHFFDGYLANPEYALETLKAAERGGAECLCLCETNGGMLPFQIENIIKEIKDKVTVSLGIHCHNDSGCGVGNTIMAVKQGCEMVQGTINGLGERCGNANLCSIIPDLKFKMGLPCIDKKNIKNLTKVSRQISELANLAHDEKQPFVGNSAFAHKGGIHVSAVQKNSKTYEHIEPELVGNHRRVLVSELSGRSNLLYKAKEFGVDLDKDDPNLRPVLNQLKELENKGFQFESSEASFELLLLKGLGKFKPLFKVLGFRVINEQRENKEMYCEATIKIEVDGQIEHTAAEGNGPVNALDNALRKALSKFYPIIKKINLTDYKVRVLEESEGTSATVRVIIESSDSEMQWGTVGASENIIEASWAALIDSINYYFLKVFKK